MALQPGQKSQKNLIYKCNTCGKLEAMLKNEVATVCSVCDKKDKKQHWLETRQILMPLAKNVKQMVEDRKTRTDRISDKITQFCGNVHFVYLHIIWFGAWLIYNFLANDPFDPYPFGMLTLIVSLEAIILATFILISQNRQGEITDIRSEADYQIDLKSEKKVAEILAILKEIRHDIEKESDYKKNK